MTTNKRIEYLPLALVLGGFLALSYVLCVGWDILFPQWAMREAWAPYLPGFEWLTVGSFFLGLVEALAYGFWFALVVPACRWLADRYPTTRGAPVRLP
ncbi:MAG: hypothetical protein ACE5F5_07755 [Acidimicrobiia bacterium]